jgi:transposase-like protein
VPKPYPCEFRDDVIAAARGGEAPLKQVAKDFGIFESRRANWLRAADAEDGTRPGVARDESAQLGELRKRDRPLVRDLAAAGPRSGCRSR